jgi:hypothetical protein
LPEWQVAVVTWQMLPPGTMRVSGGMPHPGPASASPGQLQDLVADAVRTAMDQVQLQAYSAIGYLMLLFSELALEVERNCPGLSVDAFLQDLDEALRIATEVPVPFGGGDGAGAFAILDASSKCQQRSADVVHNRFQDPHRLAADHSRLELLTRLFTQAA